MAHPEYEEAPSEPVSDYNVELDRRHARFKALGGGELIENQVGKFIKLADQVTDAHRGLVKDLAASGLSNDAIARVLGISKERLQTLFEYELGTGFEMAHANLARSLFFAGMAGDTTAASNWLKLHNRSEWASKSHVTGKDGGPIETDDKGSADARNFVSTLLKDMLVNPSYKGVKKPLPKIDSEPAPKPKPAKEVKGQIKKPRSDK